MLRLGEALHRELERYGITVTTRRPGMSNTAFVGFDFLACSDPP